MALAVCTGTPARCADVLYRSVPVPVPVPGASAARRRRIPVQYRHRDRDRYSTTGTGTGTGTERVARAVVKNEACDPKHLGDFVAAIRAPSPQLMR